MKRLNTLLGALVVSMALTAQTMNVEMGQVTHCYKAAKTGRMSYNDSQHLTINGLTYTIGDITGITVDDSAVEEASVMVTYDGESAAVRISGDVAPFITAKVNGAHVTVLAASNLEQEITYTLSGSSTNGSFYMDGKLKATFVFNNLSLVNPDSAAVNLQCGKRLKIKLEDGTENVLADGINGANDGSDAHKAAFYINGHSEWTGGGKLTVLGTVKHALATDEYVEFGKKLGTVFFTTKNGDGLHVNEYFEMKGGIANFLCQGDGIDVEKKKSSEDERNGQIIISGGKLEIYSDGYANKGMKCEGDMLISDGNIYANTTGQAVYDAAENDISSCACAKPDGTFTMTGGEIKFISTGAGGKGINANGAITISGGTLTVVTLGDVFEDGSLDTKPHAIKCDADIVLEGGSVLSCASQEDGNAFKTDFYVFMNGATVMGVGGKKTSPATTSTCNFKNYKDVKVVGGQTLSYDGVTFTIPEGYSNSSAKIVVSSPSM